MTRVLGFFLHNWPLKLAAVLLATILYAGLVLSQNARVWPGTVPIQVLNQPPSAFILNELPDVTGIRFFAPTQSIERLSSAAFIASIDLADAEIDPNDPFIDAEVTLRAADPSVNILDFRPRRVTVRLDPVVRATVPVQVAHGVVPDGLEAGIPELSQESVELTGPQSVVSQVVAVEARVRIQPSGIDVDQLVDLVAVDARGEQLTPVEIAPSAVRVRIEVTTDITTKTVPVTPVVTGSPADGFAFRETTVEPSVVTISGNADLLATVTSVQTRPIAVDGATADVAVVTGLELPEGVTVVGSGEVAVTVSLAEQEATRTLAAGVVLAGTQSDRTYALGAEQVVVTLGGSLRAVDGVAPGSFTATADVDDLGEGQHEVAVRVNLPGDVRLISVSPARVTVFVSPRATPPPTPTPAPTPTPTPTPTAAPTATPAAATAAPTAAIATDPPTAPPPSPSPPPDASPSP